MFEIKDYLTPAYMTEHITNPFAKASAPKKPSRPDIKVKVSGCDILITRTTTQTEKTLAILVSQGLYFVRNEKTKEDAPLTRELLRSFLGKTDVIDIVDDETGEPCLWLGSIERDSQSIYRFMDILNDAETDPGYKEFLSKGYIFVDSPASYHYLQMTEDSKRYLQTFAKRLNPEQRKLFAKAMGDGARYYGPSNLDIDIYRDIIRMYTDSDLVTFFNRADGWGISGTTDFFLNALESPLERLCDARYFVNVVFKRPSSGFKTTRSIYRSIDAETAEFRPFKRKDLEKYLFFDSEEQGASSNPDPFVSSYGDYLAMRDDMAEISAKEYPLYPKNLLSDEARIAHEHRQYSLLQEQIADEDWKEYVRFLAKYEYTDSARGLMITSPKTKKDMLNEAVSQHNCLSSYINRVREGECMIFFLRKTSRPDHSFVTVEVLADGSLGQVKAACNKRAPEDAMDFVRKWHHKFFEAETETAVA